MRTAKQFYANPKNRELVKSATYNRLARMGKIPETFTISEGHLKGWVGQSVEVDGSRTSHDVAPRRVDHKGWYVDSMEDETVCGIVVQIRIPRKRARLEKVEADRANTFSRVRFVEGIRDPWGSDIVSRLSRDVHDDDKDCAASADSEAERHAEESREGDAKYQAEEEIKRLREEVKESRKEIVDIVAERRAIKRQAVPDLFREAVPAPRADALCRAISGRVAELKHSIEKAKKRIEALDKNFWLSVGRG